MEQMKALVTERHDFDKDMNQKYWHLLEVSGISGFGRREQNQRLSNGNLLYKGKASD